MKFDSVELRTMEYYLSKAFESEKKSLKMLNEDTDEYVELANDLMVLDVIISKIKNENSNNSE